MKIFVETERLILRELLPTDVDGMYELDSDPAVHKYLGNNPVKDKAQIIEVINFVRQQYIDNGIGRWAIIEKTNNTFIGWAGLKLVKEMTNNHINHYDLGYRLIRKYWGQGLATESAKAAVAYGFDQLNIKEIFAAAHIENHSSNNLLQKLGFKLVETYFDFDDLNNWYRIGRDEFYH